MRVNHKKGLAIALGCMAAATLSVSLLAMKDGGQVRAEDYVLSPSAEIKSEYALDTTFTVPSASFEKDGQTYAADYTYLVYPDQQAKGGDEFLLDQAGEYRLVYSANIGGKKVSEEKTFFAADVLYEVGNEASYVEYNDALALSRGTQSGIKVGLVSGDTFTYNKPINLNEVGDNALFRFYPYNCTQVFGDPAPDGLSLQAQFYYIRLVDCYDPTNYMTIKFRWYGQSAMYIQAGMSNQPNVGVSPGDTLKNPGSEKYVNIDGEQHLAYYDIRYGRYTLRRADGDGMRLYFDNETKRLYVQNSGSKDKLLITDFDNSDIYGDKAYGGFTTGEVYLTVTASTYLNGATHANFELANVAGEALENKELYVDKNAPVASIDKYDGDVIYVAKNQPFNVFEATYADVNGVRDSKVSAYYGYGTPTQTEVSVANGKFIPTREGMYTLVYTAHDAFGAESKTLASVYCVECTDDKAVQFSVDKLTKVSAGGTVALPIPTVESINKGAFYKAYYVHKESGERTEITGEDFLPVRLGTHELTYVYGDAYLEYTYSYDFTVSASNNVIFGEINTPKYLMQGFKYTLEDVIATTFGGKKETYSAASVYVAEDGGAYSAKAIDPKGYTVNAHESVRFKYVKNGVSVESEEIPVINVKSGDDVLVEKYFVGDVTKTADLSKGVMLRANATSGDSSVDFINDLTVSNFVFAFDVPADAAAFSGLKLTFTDYYDRTKVKEVSLLKNGSGTKLVCGDSFVEMDKAFAGNNFRLEINGRQMVDGSNGVTFVNDFTFERVFLTVTFLDIEGTAGIDVGEINGQTMSNVAWDVFEPVILFNNPDTGYATFGATATVHKAIGADVLSPYYEANLTVSVTAPNGSYVKAKDGTLLSGKALANKSYEITLNQYGRYSITYCYEDQAENYVELVDYYVVLDDKAPVLKLTDVKANSTVTATLGDEITVSGVSVSDNIDSAEEISVWILAVSPDHESKYLGNGTFTADKAGIWTIKYMCMDVEGNYSLAQYYIEVAEVEDVTPDEGVNE